MAMKMDRRAFLKTSAAMAAAVSMTGLLGGCSDGDGGTEVWPALQATVGALRGAADAYGRRYRQLSGKAMLWSRYRSRLCVFMIWIIPMA